MSGKETTLPPGKWFVDTDGDVTPVCEHLGICAVHGHTMDAIKENREKANMLAGELGALGRQVGSLEATVTEVRHDVNDNAKCIKEHDGRVGEIESTIAVTNVELKNLIGNMKDVGITLKEMAGVVKEVTAEMGKKVAQNTDNLHKMNLQLVVMSLKITGIFTAGSGAGWFVGKHVFGWW